ncbi:Fanconi anemia group A protein [Aulostomus maculatus]
MSLSESCESVSQKRTLSSLLAGRVVKRPRQGDGERLQEAVLQLLEQEQDLLSLLREAENPNPLNHFSAESGESEQAVSQGIPSTIAGSLLVCELRRQATQLGVPLAAMSVKMVLERLTDITETQEVKEDKRRAILTSSQRVQLCALLESCRELQSHGAICPQLLWQEYRRDQRRPKLDVVYHLHLCNILTLKDILESDEGVRSWLVSQLKALCSWTPPQGEKEAKQVQQKVLSTVVGVLVGTGFQSRQEAAASQRRRSSLLCCSVMDDMLFWLLDTGDNSSTQQSAGSGAELWCQLFDASLCEVSASSEALQLFFTHSLTQTLTYKPRLTVSDAITLQNEWTFAKSNRLLTSLFRKLAVIFSVEQLLRHLQQVLETHEVNWKHVLCFISTLLVYNPRAQPSLRELLSRLLSSAFEGYDLENMITAFLLARQGALEGPAIFPSYSDWFKVSFGGGGVYHATSKKSLVFLLKFLSDLVPFEPPQYLKVHLLHPPYVPVKHRSLLMEYVSLAKTRLADLKESVEEMGLYGDVSGAAGAAAQPQCQAVQDVEKAISLFESTGRISATVMEASIFRRPYFLTRFLPALLKPRVLPVKADAWMSFIEALKKADKVPAAQFSSYVESCKRLRQQKRSVVDADAHDDPCQVLQFQLQELRQLVADGNEGETSAQLSRISHTLNVILPGHPDDLAGQKVIKLQTDTPQLPELHIKVVDMILRNFCQCTLDSSGANPPNKQNLWASAYVSTLLGNPQLLSSLLQRLWHLFHHQAPSLSAAHLLGLAAFVVHLHASVSHSPLAQMAPPLRAEPVPVAEALCSALVCNTNASMLFCVRFCVAAVCYGICRGDSLPQQPQQDYILSSLYKKLLYLIPRLLPEARRTLEDGPVGEHWEENNLRVWNSSTDTNSSWRKTACSLWRHPVFRQLQHLPQYQLLFTEWLSHELRVQRSEDALSDPERLEYQQWACLELYLPQPEEQGGCGGDMKRLCSHLLNAVMEQQLSEKSLGRLDVLHTGSCLPDILCRLQELVCEMELTSLSGTGQTHVCDFLFELASQRFSASESVNSQLSLQHTLDTWNRVLLALPSVSFIKVKTEGSRVTLDCDKLIQHVNQHQRKMCLPVGLLSFHLTSHFLRGVLCASLRCGRSGENFNKAWSQISIHCPLLLLSTAYWWERLSRIAVSLWSRLCDGETLPEQLQLLSDSQNWTCSLKKGQLLQIPSAPALVVAASLYSSWRGCAEDEQDLRAALNMLRTERDYREVLVLLLFLCVNSYLLALLYPQERSHQTSRSLCTQVLTVLVDSLDSDWLLIFKANEKCVVTMVTSAEFTRLMPWAFFSLLQQQRAELLHKVLCCPGFLNIAVSCYISLLQLCLDGHTPALITELPDSQTEEPSQILSQAKLFVLRAISQTSPTSLSSRQLSQLESQCAGLDPEVAAALSMHLDPHRLSPEMDFL